MKITKRQLIKIIKECIEEIDVNDLSSGMLKTKHSTVKDVLSSGEVIETKKGKFKPVKPIKSGNLKKGDYFLGYYSKYNQGADIYKFNGFTGDETAYGEGKITLYSSLKDLLKKYNVKKLSELEALQNENEYGYQSYMNVTDVDSGETGSWFYLYKGRWSRGSGAEYLSFHLLKKV